MAEASVSPKRGSGSAGDLEPLLAKEAGGRFQTLADHTRWALLCLRKILERPAVQAKATWLGVMPDQLARSAFLAVAFHDAGKASRRFQNNLRAGRRTRAFPHPLASALILLRVVGGGSHLWPAWPYPVLEALAVLAHHTELHVGLYRSISPAAKPDLDIPRLAAFLREIPRWWAELGFGAWGAAPALQEGWAELLHQVDGARAQDVLARLQKVTSQVAPAQRPRLKATYTLLLAALVEADHAASRAFEASQDPETGLLVQDSMAVARRVREKIHAETARTRLRPFQQQAEAAGAGRLVDGEGHGSRPCPASGTGCLSPCEQVVMAVPCGRGKTNAALLWWAGQAERGRVDRLIWAMPTQVTSNTLYERLTTHVGPELVGLYHGHSLLERSRKAAAQPPPPSSEEPASWEKLIRLLDDAEEAPLQTDPEALRSENRLGEWLARQMTVTTVDHLLYAFCHAFGKADYALGNLQTAAVVFDEVHYYDTQMLAHLREAFRLLRAMGVPHLLMSGTLPASLLAQFGIEITRGTSTGGETTYFLIEDPEGEGYRPFHLRKRSEPLLIRTSPEEEEVRDSRWTLHPEAVELLEEGRQQGWTQLVVVNTVRRAQDAYLDLKARWGEEQVGLLHSRFAYQDRRTLEESLLKRLRQKERGLVVVATQVVEISLDLSVRRMLTELAPLDALGQRAGRVNRGAAEPEKGEVWVWLCGDGLPYQRGPLDWEGPKGERLLERSWELLSEGTPPLGSWRQLCDEVYRSRTLGPSNLPELVSECSLFGHGPKTIRFDEEHGRLFRPRAILQPTINVVARDLLDELGDEAYDELWHVPVPQWWVLRSLAERTGHFFVHHYRSKPFLVCTLPYHHDLGFYERIGSAESGAIIDLE